MFRGHGYKLNIVSTLTTNSVYLKFDLNRFNEKFQKTKILYKFLKRGIKKGKLTRYGTLLSK